MIDLLGFAGSGLIIVSLTMKSMVRLRLVGLAGALLFVLYGLWIGALPVVATNLATSTIQITRLLALRTPGRTEAAATATPTSVLSG